LVPPISPVWTVMPMIELRVFNHQRLTCTQMQSIIHVAKPEQAHRVRVNYCIFYELFGPLVSRDPIHGGLSTRLCSALLCSSPPPPSLSLPLSPCAPNHCIWLHSPHLPILLPPLSKTRPALSSLHLYKGEREPHLTQLIITPIKPRFASIFSKSQGAKRRRSLFVHPCVPYSRRPTLSSPCRRRRRQKALAARRAGEA
jgi:hypothetical protein